jgi:hypothetical protein
MQTGSVQTTQLNPRIGPAAPQLYESIRDAKDWKNPYLVVRPDGIEVLAGGLPSGRTMVAVTDLQRTLVDLPLTAWPYGRVVAATEIGIRAADRSGQKRIADNLDKTLAILKNLKVTVYRWPN